MNSCPFPPDFAPTWGRRALPVSRGCALACPIAAYAGASDPHTTVDDMQAWGRETTSGLQARMFPGGHFFIQTARDEVLALLRQDLTASVVSQAMAGIEL